MKQEMRWPRSVELEGHWGDVWCVGVGVVFYNPFVWLFFTKKRRDILLLVRFNVCVGRIGVTLACAHEMRNPCREADSGKEKRSQFQRKSRLFRGRALYPPPPENRGIGASR